MLVFFPTTMLKSDSDNEVNAVDDDDLVQEKAAPAKKGRRKPTSKRKNVQPAANRKKVRKTRVSPFNKKSGSILGRAGNLDLSLNTDFFDDSTSYSPTAVDEVVENLEYMRDSDSDGDSDSDDEYLSGFMH